MNEREKDGIARLPRLEGSIHPEEIRQLLKAGADAFPESPATFVAKCLMGEAYTYLKRSGGIWEGYINEDNEPADVYHEALSAMCHTDSLNPSDLLAFETIVAAHDVEEAINDGDAEQAVQAALKMTASAFEKMLAVAAGIS